MCPNVLTRWIDSNKPFLLDTHRLLWVAFAAIYGLKTFGFLIPDNFNMWLIAIILGILGLALIRDADTGLKLPIALLVIAVAFALLVRLFPYSENSIPLGYDPGLYKRVFEDPMGEGVGIYPLPFSLLMAGISQIFGMGFTLTVVFLVLSASTAFAIYLVGKSMYSKEAGIAAALFFAVSLAQYDAFVLNYYKNVFGIIALLFSYLLFDRSKRVDWLFILVGVIIAGMHQLALAVFGLTYIGYFLLNIRKYKFRELSAMVINGVLILLFTLLTNYDRADTYIFGQATDFFGSVTTISRGGTDNGGAYIDSELYFNNSAPMIAFAITGLLAGTRSRPLTISSVILALLVVAKLFFYRRFLIYFDIVLLIFAGVGFLRLLSSSEFIGDSRFRYAFLSVVLLLMGAGVFNKAQMIRPLVSESQLADIIDIGDTLPDNALIIPLDSYYYPWFYGWTEQSIESPGIWGDDHTVEQWESFWGGEAEFRLQFLSEYPRPLFLVQGPRSSELAPFDPQCFAESEFGRFTVYEVICP